MAPRTSLSSVKARISPSSATLSSSLVWRKKATFTSIWIKCSTFFTEVLYARSSVSSTWFFLFLSSSSAIFKLSRMLRRSMSSRGTVSLLSRKASSPEGFGKAESGKSVLCCPECHKAAGQLSVGEEPAICSLCEESCVQVMRESTLSQGQLLHA
ncbi:hypothetical protein E2C01_019915 [Portunus trituberculatus]|uniref:Uncharacterized protein n=1 Tax=Portunus trituberculatus TaxID=210409 RepID=A0A5B7DZ76_PORTR|nr:hypothetical protein [Portunus trituberculatus]